MAVVQVTKAHDTSGEVNTTRGRRFSQAYTVHCDNELDDSTDIEKHAKIPWIGTPYPNAPKAIVVGINSQRREDTRDPWVWDTTVTWERSQTGDQPAGDPAPIEELIAQPPEFSSVWNASDFYHDCDFDGFLIDDTAGIRFADPPPLTGGLGRWTFRRYEWLNEAVHQEAAGKTNRHDWLGQYAYTCKIESITSSQQFLNGWNFYHVTYEILIRDLPAGPRRLRWHPTWVINAGPMSKGKWISGDGTAHPGGAKKHCVDSTGMPTSQPMYLDIDGYQAPIDSDPVWLDFKTIEFFDFNQLGLYIPPAEWGGHGR